MPWVVKSHAGASHSAVPQESAASHGCAASASGVDGAPAGHDHGSSDACNACAAYCSLTPLLGTVPALSGPQDPVALRFASVAALAPSFVSDGQERPPRTH